MNVIYLIARCVIQGCAFNLCQSLHRKIKSEHNLNDGVNDLRKYICYHIGLAQTPQHEIANVLEVLRRQYRPNIAALEEFDQ